jgi:parvulin-like peptidyl-prolyl isomerase
MLKYGLPALLVAALGAATLAPGQAQGTKKPVAKKPPARTTAPGQTATPGGSQVAASVDGKPITWDQLIARLRKDNPQMLTASVAEVVGKQAADSLFGPENRARYSITKEEALALLRKQPTAAIRGTLQNMIVEEALTQVATKENANPTEAQVNARISKIFAEARKQNLIPANMTDAQFLASRNLSRAQIAATVRRQLVATTLIQKEMAKSLGHPIGPDDFLQARHILIRVPEAAPDAKPEETKKADADALARINQIAEEVKSGKKTFEKAAEESSDDSSKTKGGDLGPFMRGMMVKEFEEAAFKLKPGEVSPPVRTQFGYHLIKLEKLGKDIPEEERQRVLDQQAQNRLQSFLSELLQQRVKVVNNLPAPPPMMMPPGMGGEPGGPRPVGPGGVRPGGLRPPVNAPAPPR